MPSDHTAQFRRCAFADAAGWMGPRFGSLMVEPAARGSRSRSDCLICYLAIAPTANLAPTHRPVTALLAIGTFRAAATQGYPVAVARSTAAAHTSKRPHMPDTFQDLLKSRRDFSLSRLSEVQAHLRGAGELHGLAIYVTGSYGRLEASRSSDLDVFIVADNCNDEPAARTDQILLKARLIEGARRLEFPEFSNEGSTWRHCRLARSSRTWVGREMTTKTTSPLVCFSCSKAVQFTTTPSINPC